MESKSPAHPLDGKEEWECYDQHISERNRLIEGKRSAEEQFVKTVIQLSSAIALLVPGFLTASSEGPRVPSCSLVAGLVFIFLSLTFGLIEQYISSVAYSRQIEKTDAYYLRKISDVSPPAFSKIVSTCLLLCFICFLMGILLLTSSLMIGPWR